MHAILFPVPPVLLQAPRGRHPLSVQPQPGRVRPTTSPTALSSAAPVRVYGFIRTMRSPGGCPMQGGDALPICDEVWSSAAPVHVRSPAREHTVTQMGTQMLERTQEKCKWYSM